MQAADAAALDLPALERGLPPDEVDRRVAAFAHAAEQGDAGLAFYLWEVKVRRLHYGDGHRSTALWAEARHGVPPAKTWKLLRAAEVCARSPVLREAFARGEVRLYKLDPLKEVIGLGEDEKWAAIAADRSVNDEKLRSMVKRRLGDEPDDEHVWVRVKMAPSQYRAYLAALEKARRVAGAQIDEAECLEAISVDYVNAIHDESELDAGLVRLDPIIPRAADGKLDVTHNEPTTRGAPVEHRGDPDESYRSVTGDVPMPASGSELERDHIYRYEQLWLSGWRCEVCGARWDLTIDHVESRAQAPKRRWDRSNGACLCGGCHDLKTNGLLRIRRRPDGTLEIRRPSESNRPPERWE